VSTVPGSGQTARRYLAHDAIESWKSATEYCRHHQRLGFEAIEPSTLQALQAERDRLVGLYGPVFETGFGWAAHALGKRDRVGLEAIEAAMDLVHIRPYYRMASHGVHAAPKGMFFSMSQPRWPPTVLLTGPSKRRLG
jgi:hypothetical protein